MGDGGGGRLSRNVCAKVGTDRVGHIHYSTFFIQEGGFNYSREMGPNTSLEWVQMTRLIFFA